MDLKDFHISDEVGFLLEDPLEFLPPNFESWNEVARTMPERLDDHTFREHLQKMPLLDHTKLVGHREKRLANLQLSLMAMGYVWQDGIPGIPSILPECLAVPLWGTSEYLGIHAIGCHANLYLANWQRKDPNRELSFENMRCLYCLSGGMDSQHFFTIASYIEYQFSPAVKAIASATQCISRGDETGLIDAFNIIVSRMLEMKETFARIHGLVDPEIFYHRTLCFFKGYGVKWSPMTTGMIFEGVREEPITLDGDTGAQTPIIHVMDAFLGIKHDPERFAFLLTTRKGVMPVHRRFIESLENLPSTREFVLASSNEDLKTAYDNCVSALAGFRSYHLQSVTKYEIIPKRNMDEANGIKVTTRSAGSEAAYPLSWLKAQRDGTLGHKCNS